MLTLLRLLSLYVLGQLKVNVQECGAFRELAGALRFLLVSVISAQITHPEDREGCREHPLDPRFRLLSPANGKTHDREEGMELEKLVDLWIEDIYLPLDCQSPQLPWLQPKRVKLLSS